MATKLEHELSKLKQGGHICLIYKNTAEQTALAVSFIMDGLHRGERCLYIADEHILEEVVQALAAEGVDVAQERQRGALRFVTSQNTYLRDGEFVPQAMKDWIRQAETEALADGFSGLRLRHSADRLQRLSRRLLEVQEEERRHLARELHDEIGQMLTGMGLILKTNVDLTTDVAKAAIAQARVLVDELLEKVRQLSFDLRPAALDQLGLLPGLLALFDRYTRQTGILVDFKHHGLDGRLAPEVETTAYRIVQEALTNVARHAGAAGVSVRVWASADTLTIYVEDRSRGFDLEAVLATPRSGGLPGMQERATLLGGRLTIESRPGAGTQITAELPLSEVGRAIGSRDHDERTGATTE